jgi:lipopolysaccharide transport system permease protein
MAVLSVNQAPALRVLTPPRWTPWAVISGVWRLSEYVDLLIVLARHRIYVRYKQSVLGVLWALLQPLSMMVVYTIVFSWFIRVPTGGVPHAIFAYAGILPWTFFATTVSNGTTSLVSHSQLVTKVYFPREILPLSYVVAAAADFVIASSALVGLMVWFDVPMNARVMTVLPLMFVISAFGLACALVLSALYVKFRDIGMALPVALQLWMFATPVLYPAAAVPNEWRFLYSLNPMTGLVENFRRGVLGTSFDIPALVAPAILTLILLPIAYLIFKRVEATMADVI